MPVTRRQFFRTELAACGLVPSLADADRPGRRSLNEIGIIGSVPKDAGADWQKSLRHMAEIGYRYLTQLRYQEDL